MALLRFCGVGGSKQSQGPSGSPGPPHPSTFSHPGQWALPGGQLDLGLLRPCWGAGPRIPVPSWQVRSEGSGVWGRGRASGAVGGAGDPGRAQEVGGAVGKKKRFW